MGHKVNPHGARVGVIFDWSTRWYAGKKDFANNLNEDFRLRKMLKEKYNAAGISRIDIERSASRMTVTLFAGKPGMVIGRSGKGIDEIRADVEKFCGHAVNIRVLDVKNPDADAQLIAENIAQQLEKRIGFRRAMKQSIQRAMKLGVKGVKARGRRVTAFNVKDVEELVPLRMPEPEPIPADPEPDDNDNSAQTDDDNTEKVDDGQLSLF